MKSLNLFLSKLALVFLSLCVSFSALASSFKLPDSVAADQDGISAMTEIAKLGVPLGIGLMLVIGAFMFGGGIMGAYREYQKSKEVKQFFTDAGVGIVMIIIMAVIGAWVGSFAGTYFGA